MDAIVSGEFEYGVPPQDVLALRYNVSRTVLREAIAKLEANNVLDSRPKIGTKVKPRSEWLLINQIISQNYFKNNSSKQQLGDTLDLFYTAGSHAAYLTSGRIESVLEIFPPFEFDVQGVAEMHRWIFEKCGNAIYAQMGTLMEEFILATADAAGLENPKSTNLYYHRNIYSILAGEKHPKTMEFLRQAYSNLYHSMYQCIFSESTKPVFRDTPKEEKVS